MLIYALRQRLWQHPPAVRPSAQLNRPDSTEVHLPPYILFLCQYVNAQFELVQSIAAVRTSCPGRSRVPALRHLFSGGVLHFTQLQVDTLLPL